MQPKGIDVDADGAGVRDKTLYSPSRVIARARFRCRSQVGTAAWLVVAVAGRLEAGRDHAGSGAVPRYVVNLAVLAVHLQVHTLQPSYKSTKRGAHSSRRRRPWYSSVGKITGSRRHCSIDAYDPSGDRSWLVMSHINDSYRFSRHQSS